MARPIWKGHISFGLINVPVILYSAENRVDLKFHMLDRRNDARIRYERVNDETGKQVPWDQIVKAYEFKNGSYVTLEEEDFKKAAVAATQTVEIEDFVDRDEIELPYFETPYYLVPQKKGEKGYVLLREALEKTGKVGIAKVVIHTRQYLAALLPQKDALMLNLMRFDQELRKPEDFELPTKRPAAYEISAREMSMAEQLVESMSAKWDPKKYHDEYREALLEWITDKAEAQGEVMPARGEEEEEKVSSAEVIDLMDLLKRSVAATHKAAKTASKPKSPAKKSAPHRKRAAG